MGSITKKFVLLRLKQLFRVFKQDIGIGHLILLLPILIPFVLGVLQVVSTAENIAVAVFLLFMVGSIHWTRKDRFFLEQLAAPLFLFLFLDYILLCSPILFCIIFWAKWYNLLTFIGGALLISFIKPSYGSISNRKLLNLVSLKWIPLPLFEWRSGLRKDLFVFIFLYLIGLVFCYYPITIPVVLFLIALRITKFFHFFESKDLLLAVNKNQQLLKIKAFGSLKLFNGLMLPLYILFIIFHHNYQYLVVLLIIGIISQLLIVFSICLKYKSYRFHYNRVYSSTPMAFFIACLPLPFLWPIPIIMVIQFWKSAQQNLMHHYA
jgi:hypothetical protein